MAHMDEGQFVRLFIRKERRERLMYELTHPEKQRDGLDRFCHQSKELLDPKRVMMEGGDLERREDFRRFVAEHDELCFVLSLEFYLDEALLPLQEAVRQAAFSMDAVLILGSNFAIVFGEPMKGGREKYLLSAEERKPKDCQ